VYSRWKPEWTAPVAAGPSKEAPKGRTQALEDLATVLLVRGASPRDQDRDLLERLFLEERRQLKIIPDAFGEACA
jgi:hypothetical protein